MPKKPDAGKNINIESTPDNTAKVYNAILNDIAPSGSQLDNDLQAAVPDGRVTQFNGNNENEVMRSIRLIGDVITDQPTYRNSFNAALWNRIGKVRLNSRTWENNYKNFRQGILQNGESIEEIFVELAKPFGYDPEKAEWNVNKRQLPDVHTQFHRLNYKKFYKITTDEDELRQAFLSMDGLRNYVDHIVQQMFEGAEYDENLVTRYLWARLALDGFMGVQQIPVISETTSNQALIAIKAISNKMTRRKRDYNYAGVLNFSPKARQNVLIEDWAEATISVESLSAAFNLEYSEYIGKRQLLDDFSEIDMERLAELFADEPNYVPFTPDELTALGRIKIILMDDEFTQIWDYKRESYQKFNEEGTWTNHWYHVWSVISASMFNNCVLFMEDNSGEITALTISPTASTVDQATTLQFTATVTADPFINKGVRWSVTGAQSSGTYITGSGLLVIGKYETSTSLTVTATSIAKNASGSNLTANATITVNVVNEAKWPPKKEEAASTP